MLGCRGQANFSKHAKMFNCLPQSSSVPPAPGKTPGQAGGRLPLYTGMKAPGLLPSPSDFPGCQTASHADRAPGRAGRGEPSGRHPLWSIGQTESQPTGHKDAGRCYQALGQEEGGMGLCGMHSWLIADHFDTGEVTMPSRIKTSMRSLNLTVTELQVHRRCCHMGTWVTLPLTAGNKEVSGSSQGFITIFFL